MVPEARVVNGSDLLALGRGGRQGTDGSLSLADAAEVNDVKFTVVDHLVSDLHEETGHTLVGVVVPRNRVDHLDGVHESGKGLLD